MNPLKKMLNRRPPGGARPLAALLAGTVVVTTVLGSVHAADSAAKDHVLFVGTDLSVKQDGEFYHVVGAKKTALLIEKKHRLEDVRLGQGANIKVTRGVKLSNLSANISNVQTESIDHASARAQLAAMRAAMLLADEASDQEDRLHGKMTLLSAVQSSSGGPTPPPGANISGPSVRDMQKAAEAAYVGALPQLDQAAASASTFLSQAITLGAPVDDEVTLDASALPGLKLLGGSGDSGSPTSSSANSYRQGHTRTGTAEVELTFDVSSPVPLEHAYIVVVANYGSSSKPEEMARQISTKEFGHVDSRPQRVKMVHAASVNGLPFRKFDMGLYANGQEVATNLSEKRMDLTSDQAYQFFLIDYLSKHRGETLPPATVLMTPRSEFRRQLEAVSGSPLIFANIDKAGKVLTLTVDGAADHQLSAPLEPMLQNVRFMPALEKGVPVDGRLKFRLAQLVD